MLLQSLSLPKWMEMVCNETKYEKYDTIYLLMAKIGKKNLRPVPDGQGHLDHLKHRYFFSGLKTFSITKASPSKLKLRNIIRTNHAYVKKSPEKW